MVGWLVGMRTRKRELDLRFLISNFRCVLNVVFGGGGDFPASEFYMPTFRNTSIFIGGEDGTVCSETSAYKIQMPGNHPKESI